MLKIEKLPSNGVHNGLGNDVQVQNGEEKPTVNTDHTASSISENHDVELPSEEYRDIMGRSPGWLLSWGLTAFLTFLTIIFTLAYFIQYPDTLDSKIQLISNNPPVSILARNSGFLQLEVINNDHVQKNQFLGMVVNDISYASVTYIKSWLDTLRNTLLTNNLADLRAINILELDLGSLQEPVINLIRGIERIHNDDRLGNLTASIYRLNDELLYSKTLDSIKEREVLIEMKEYELAKRKFRIDSGLWAKNAISDWDFLVVRSNYLSAQKNVHTRKKEALMRVQSRKELLWGIDDKLRSRREEMFKIRENMMSLIDRLELSIDKWEKEYVLISPIEGHVDFYNFWRDNEYVKNGEELMSIIPLNSGEVYGQVEVGMNSVGKIEKGMQVIIDFESFPKGDFGVLEGSVLSISAMPQNEMYLVRVRLKNKLSTTYSYDIPFRQEMGGNAKIITRKQSLLSRMTAKMTESIM